MNIPLNEQNFITEVNKIYQIAEKNGYDKKIVDSFLRKHQLKKEMRNLTSLTPLNSSNSTCDGVIECYSGGIFVNGFSIPLARALKRHSIILSPNSNGYKLKTHLGNTKDKVEDHKKSGIYAVLCADCDSVYIGQCCRACEKRFSEHYKPYHDRQFGRSTPADHMLENHHEFAGFRLLKEVNKPQYLDAYEDLYIYKTKRNNMNVQQSQITSLLKFTKPLSTNDIFDGKH